MFEREIAERLARIETTLDVVDERTRDTHDILHGNGQPGLVTRVDRLEQSEKARRWTVRALIGAGLIFLSDLAVRFWRG